jgi:hypothetical protein
MNANSFILERVDEVVHLTGRHKVAIEEAVYGGRCFGLTIVSVAALALQGTVSIDGTRSAVKITVSGGASK